MKSLSDVPAPKSMLRCDRCKGFNIQHQVWLRSNTEEVMDDAIGDHSCWCEDCDDHTHMELVEPDVHVLKVWPEFYDDLLEGRKRWELRKADRDFKQGDYLLLREWTPEREEYSGRELWFRVTYVRAGAPLPDGYCGMSIEAV